MFKIIWQNKGSNSKFNNDNYWKNCLQIFKSTLEMNEQFIKSTDGQKSSPNKT